MKPTDQFQKTSWNQRGENSESGDEYQRVQRKYASEQDQKGSKRREDRKTQASGQVEPMAKWTEMISLDETWAAQ